MSGPEAATDHAECCGGRVTVPLDSVGMGPEATAEDYSDWVEYVAARIDGLTGLDVTIEPARFGSAAPSYRGEHDDTINEALYALYENFFGEDSPRASMPRPGCRAREKDPTP